MLSCGCAGTWIFQPDKPTHKTMSLNCPRTIYDEQWSHLHHAYTTQQHKAIKIKKQGE